MCIEQASLLNDAMDGAADDLMTKTKSYPQISCKWN